MTSHGGKRPGAGGPPKPPLTPTELKRAYDRCIELNGGRVTDRGLVQAINEERTRGYVDPRSLAKHSVSSWWVRQQRKMLRLSNIDGGSNLNTANGSRFPEYQPLGNRSVAKNDETRSQEAETGASSAEVDTAHAKDGA